MEPQTLLVVSNDKISWHVLNLLKNKNNLIFAADETTGVRRVLRLVFRRKISINLLVRMLISEIRRPSATKEKEVSRIRSNDQLLKLIRDKNPCRILLFRAGLIISREILSEGIPIFNIHCARLPEFGGIGAIWRAMQCGAIHQCATLHRITSRIDEGEVIDTEGYTLDTGKSYGYNENLAYEAGGRLLERVADLDSSEL